MWEEVFLLILDDRNVAVRSCIIACKKRYEIPESHIIKITKTNRGLVTGRELSAVSLRSKLIVISHGTERTLQTCFQGEINHFEFFELLLELGLKEAGIISFKACNIGKGTFLEDLRNELFNELEVGYLLAYKGYAVTVWRHEGVGFIDTSIRLFSCGVLKLPDHFRVKIIKGNASLRKTAVIKKRWSSFKSV